MPSAAVLSGSIPGVLPNQSSSPMMSGFVTTPQMTHDQVVSVGQMAISQQPMQMVQQPMSVAQMQVGDLKRYFFIRGRTTSARFLVALMHC